MPLLFIISSLGLMLIKKCNMDVNQICFLLVTALFIQYVRPHAFVAKLQNEKEAIEDEEMKVDQSIEDDDNEINVEPPDHLQAMKMERDGDENKNYHKEVFLGKDAEKFQNGELKYTEQEEKLKEIFQAVDLNLNGSLDEEELTVWVLTKTREHFYEARMNIEKTFEKLDRNKDGNLTWNEFAAHFLAGKGFDKEKIFQQLEAGEKIPVSEELTNQMQELREKWIQVQKPGENSLTLYQFLDFEHPETSKETLQYLVEDILHDMDADNSKDLSVQEYVAMSPGSNVDASDDVWVKERAKEFREVMDTDHDGRVVVKELAAYLDPLSRSMAVQEARELISFGDEDGDGKLTLKEILQNSEFFTGSKLYNYALSVHEEF